MACNHIAHLEDESTGSDLQPRQVSLGNPIISRIILLKDVVYACKGSLLPILTSAMTRSLVVLISLFLLADTPLAEIGPSSASKHSSSSQEDVFSRPAHTLPEPKCFAQNIAAAAASTCVPLHTLPEGTIDAQLRNATDRASITCGKDTTIPPEKLGSCPDAQATLDAHNANRASWGAAPLLWSRTLANYAQTVSNTCQFAHSNGPYGENLAIGSGLTCKRSVELWMAEAKDWPPGGQPGFSSATGHFSAIVWKTTTQVGCAIKACNGRQFITCSYNPPGNVIGSFGKQVGYKGETPECKAPTTPPIQTSPTPPPSLVKKPPPPVQKPAQPPPPPPARQCCWGRYCFAC